MTLRDDDHEQVVIRQDPETGLRLIVAVHSTVLGPSLGGMRLKRYPGGLREALEDVLALSRTMTLKASAAGLDLGGGKAVILDDGREGVREARLLAAAAEIDRLHGAYITAEDIGTTTGDMDLIATRTRYVVGRSPEHGGRGDPSPVTATTVFEAIRRGLSASLGSDDLTGRTVGVVGVGKVGSPLAIKLAEAGADVIACDLDTERVERLADEYGIKPVASAEAVLMSDLDVLSPCAAGGLIDDAIARSVSCRVVAGAANNPLTGRAVAQILKSRAILYVPDFLANCGGLIHVAGEWQEKSQLAGTARSRTATHDECIARAMDRLDHAIELAEAEDTTPAEVAEREALARVNGARAAFGEQAVPASRGSHA